MLAVKIITVLNRHLDRKEKERFIRPQQNQENDNNDDLAINVAVNYWFQAHKQVETLRDRHLELFAIDWKNQGRACDTYFAEFEQERKQGRLADKK